MANGHTCQEENSMKLATWLGELIVAFGPLAWLWIRWERVDRYMTAIHIEHRLPGPVPPTRATSYRRIAVSLIVFMASAAAAKLL
jgi:hypothetical protein